MQSNIEKCAELVSEDIITTPILHDPNNGNLGGASLRDLFEAAGFDDHTAQRTLVGWVHFMFEKEMKLYEDTNFDLNALPKRTRWQRIARYFKRLVS